MLREIRARRANDRPLRLGAARDRPERPCERGGPRPRASRRGPTTTSAKPFHFPELSARHALGPPAPLRAARRARSGSATSRSTPRGARSGSTASEVMLANKEYELLLTLASEPRRVFTKSELLRDVWDFQTMGRTRTLDSHASRLRRKLDPGGRPLHRERAGASATGCFRHERAIRSPMLGGVAGVDLAGRPDDGVWSRSATASASAPPAADAQRAPPRAPPPAPGAGARGQAARRDQRARSARAGARRAARPRPRGERRALRASAPSGRGADARDRGGGALARPRRRARAGASRVRWRCGDELADVDPVRVAQALDNLIANALEHGGGEITIEGARRGRRASSWRSAIAAPAARPACASTPSRAAATACASPGPWRAGTAAACGCAAAATAPSPRSSCRWCRARAQDPRRSDRAPVSPRGTRRALRRRGARLRRLVRGGWRDDVPRRTRAASGSCGRWS